MWQKSRNSRILSARKLENAPPRNFFLVKWRVKEGFLILARPPASAPWALASDGGAASVHEARWHGGAYKSSGAAANSRGRPAAGSGGLVRCAPLSPPPGSVQGPRRRVTGRPAHSPGERGGVASKTVAGTIARALPIRCGAGPGLAAAPPSRYRRHPSWPCRMRSSAGEHLVHTEGVTGSIPVASTT